MKNQWEFSYEKLDALRKAHGLTAVALADKLGTSRRAIYYWKSRNKINVDSLCRVAEVFGVTPASFFRETNRKPRFAVDRLDHRCCTTDPCGSATCPEAV